jgi:hypothetical protein
VEAVLVGKADVGENDVEVVFANAPQRILAVHCGFGAMAQRAEIVRHGLADVTVIVNNQQVSLDVHAEARGSTSVGLPGAEEAHGA